MEIVHPHIIEYLVNITPDRDQVLEDMEKYALERSFPIIGPLVGRFLYLITKATQAKRILELGSGFGYSAYWFAKALDKDGVLICTDSNPDNASMAQEYLRRGKLSNKVTWLIGDALKLIDEVNGLFDIIFTDIDKFQYPLALRKTVPKIRKGGLLITDNVLWSGKIFDRKPDADSAGILTHNRLIYSSRELFTTIIPLKDGISLSIKL